MRPTMVSPWLRSIAATSFLALASCGGGGGGGSSAPSGGTPPVTPTTAPVAQVSVQRTDATQALQTLHASRSFGSGGLSTLSAARRAAGMLRRVRAGLRVPASLSACSSGLEQSLVTNSNGSQTITEENFYDSTCQTPEQMLVWTVTQSGATLSGPGTITKYTQSGGVVSYQTFTMSFTYTDSTLSQLSQFTIDITSEATSVGGPSIGSTGLSCGVSGTSGSAFSCGMGAVADQSALSQELGFTMTTAASQSSTMSGTMMQSMTTVQTYQGALNALTLAAATFPTWTVSGGSQIDTASATMTESYSTGGMLSSLSFTMTDMQDGATVTITATSTGFTGTIVQTSTGATLATFTVDQFGNGTITYSNGTQGQIVDYVVVS